MEELSRITISVEGAVTQREAQIIKALYTAYHAALMARFPDAEDDPAVSKEISEKALDILRAEFPDLQIQLHHN